MARPGSVLATLRPITKKSEPYFLYFVLGILILLLIFFIHEYNKTSPSLIILPNEIFIPSEVTSYCATCTLVEDFPTFSGGYGTNITKRALLMGCNYDYVGSACVNYNCVLNGCIDDVRNIKEFLMSKLGFYEENITLLVDDGSTLFPSKAVIISSLNSIINETKSGDITFIWYSGHGAQISNSESDGGFDECWCPPDTIQNGNYLTDNQLNSIIKNAPIDSTVFIGSDSCHSGTVFDLKYIAQEISGTDSNRSIDSLRGRTSLPSDHFEKHLKSSLNQNFVSSKELIKNYSMNVLNDSFYLETSANIICVSGCQDFDTSADAYENNSPQGAMTWSFLASFDKTTTLVDLIKNMRTLLNSSGYGQVPQLTMGRIFDANKTLISEIFKV